MKANGVDKEDQPVIGEGADKLHSPVFAAVLR